MSCKLLKYHAKTDCMGVLWWTARWEPGLQMSPVTAKFGASIELLYDFSCLADTSSPALLDTRNYYYFFQRYLFECYNGLGYTMPEWCIKRQHLNFSHSPRHCMHHWKKQRRLLIRHARGSLKHAWFPSRQRIYDNTHYIYILYICM